MAHPKLDSMLLASTRPDRLAAWYASVFDPEADHEVDGYWVLTFGGFHVLVDGREDVAVSNPDPTRVILNFDVSDAADVVDRMEEQGTIWVAPLEDRDGSLFATGTDPDGNYVQVIQLSEEHRAAMA